MRFAIKEFQIEVGEFSDESMTALEAIIAKAPESGPSPGTISLD